MESNGLKVLLVEDNPTDALITEEELKLCQGISYNVTRVERLSQAMLKMKECGLDVVLLDLGLPDSTGLETFLKLQSADPTIPIVVLSGQNESLIGLKAVQAGAQDYVLKGGLTEALLTRVIRYAVERKRSGEILRRTHHRLRQLLDHSPAVLYGLKVEGKKAHTQAISENILSFLGFTVTEAMNDDWWVGRLHPDDRDAAVSGIAETLRLGQTTNQYRLRHKNGTYPWVDDNRRLIFDSMGEPEEIVGVWTDITERKKAEADSLESQALYHGLVEQLPAGIFRKDLAGRFVYTNATYCSFAGLVPADYLGKTSGEVAAAIIHSQTSTEEVVHIAGLLKQGQAHHDQIIKTGDRIAYEEVRFMRNGRKPILDVIKTPVIDAAGNIIGSQGIFFDISDRKRADMERERFFSVSLDLLGVLGFDGYFKRVNEAFLTVLGYTEAEMCARPATHFLHPDDRKSNADEIARIESGAVALNFENRYVCKDGRVCWIAWTAAPYSADCTIYVSGRDVTESKRIEESLRSSEEKFRQVVENIREVFWIVDVDADRIVYVSPAYEEIWGKSPNRLYESRKHFEQDVYPEDRERYRKAIETAMKTGKFDETYRIVRPDGSLRWIRSRSFPVRNAEGRTYRLVGVAEDMTQRKALEEQGLRAQRLESIGMLAAGITHDLNNVLAPIGMAATLLRSHLSEKSDIRLIDTLEKCADRGAGLVRQILGFVHGIGTEPTVVQVKHLLRDITAVITETFPKSITLKEKVPNELWPILANPTQIHQVLLNLCVNARDAMPEGGTLTVRAENCVLTPEQALGIEGGVAGDWVVIHIQDSGTGIPPEICARIWEPFFSTKSPSKGTGLGLSTVRGIVETCHGFIELRTEMGQGTTFRTYFPAVRIGSDGSASPIPSLSKKGRGELILLVDDEELIRDLAAATLTGAGYRVITAADGSDATVAYEKHASEIALLVTDLDMPNIDGESLATTVRKFRPQLTILAMSGAGSRQLNPNPARFANAFMSKPFTAHELLEKVDRLLHSTVFPV